MIKYALLCEVEHEFEAWFSNSEAYEDQRQALMIACPFCGSPRVRKAIMAPNIQPSRKGSASEGPSPQSSGAGADPTEARLMAEALHKLRQHIETHYDYVGSDFASEARDIHSGLSQQRLIYGEAKSEEVKALIEEGVPITPIPQAITPEAHGPLGSKTLRPQDRSKLN